MLRHGYVLLLAAVSCFLVGWATVSLLHAYGPRTHAEGRVIEAVSGTTQTCTWAPRASARGCQDWPNYTVIGERADGSTWAAVSKPAYTAMRGVRDPVVVESSSVTGLVVGLRGDAARHSWDVADSPTHLIAVGALALWAALVVAYELARRRGKAFHFGRLSAAAIPVALVGAALGGIATWYVFWAKSAAIDVPSTAEMYGEFVADPLLLVYADPAHDEPGVQVGEWFPRTGEPRLVVLDPLVLSPEARGEYDSVSDAIVVPVVLVGNATGTRGALTWTVHSSPGAIAPIDCPDGVTAFPTPIGTDTAVRAGFVCFPPAAALGDLEAIIGTGTFASSYRLDLDH